jgi:Phosphoribosylglycinamide synthetase, ATP-grasp (A) domain
MRPVRGVASVDVLQGAPIVVKADGLAAGKGVVVAQSVAEAEEAVDAMLVHQAFGAAGQILKALTKGDPDPALGHACQPNTGWCESSQSWKPAVQTVLTDWFWQQAPRW